jgi:hypothetical protein
MRKQATTEKVWRSAAGSQRSLGRSATEFEVAARADVLFALLKRGVPETANFPTQFAHGFDLSTIRRGESPDIVWIRLGVNFWSASYIDCIVKGEVRLNFRRRDLV